MERFTGFPPRAKVTPVPNAFFTQLLPGIDDPAELRVALHCFWAIAQKRGYPRFVTAQELEADASLMQGLGLGGRDARAELARGLEQATGRGLLLCLSVQGRDGQRAVYFLNTSQEQRAVQAIRKGELSLGLVVEPPSQQPGPAGAPPTIYGLYEQNIGVLTPLVAEQLEEAERLYPEEWIKDAFREAVSLNRRSWRYIQRILERWSEEGHDGAVERDPEAADGFRRLKGKYGGIIASRLRRK